MRRPKYSTAWDIFQYINDTARITKDIKYVYLGKFEWLVLSVYYENGYGTNCYNESFMKFITFGYNGAGPRTLILIKDNVRSRLEIA